MEALEDVFARWNCAAGIPDGQHNLVAIGASADPNPPARAIVLSRVLEEILHDERCVPFFAGHKQAAWKFLLDLDIGRIGKRAQIVQPLVNDLAEIYRRRGDLEMTSVHT